MNREELARVLRLARDRVGPHDVGLFAGAARRVPGLRREEVAALAGISVDYVVRLEQGRGPHPSSSVLGSLARALRLTDAERAQLFELADVLGAKAGDVLDVLLCQVGVLDRTPRNGHRTTPYRATTQHCEPARQIAARELEVERIRSAMERAQELTDDAVEALEAEAAG